MRLSLHRLGGPSTLALALGCLLPMGCSKDDSSASAAGTGGGGGSGGQVQGPSSLAFSPPDTLTLIPGEVHTLAVVATPPGVYHVSFALLGDEKDASLDKSEADTDANGRTELVVTAPSSATTFSVAASVGDSASAKLGVSVSASGFATLQVTPSYDGKRSPTYWVASVRSGTSCADLSGETPTDGDIKGTSPAGQVPQVSGVPVGPALAVTLRGAFSVFGCQDVTDLVAGEINPLSISVADLPMQLDQTNLELSLGLDPKSLDLAQALDATGPLAALDGQSDVTSLLDAMQARASDPGEFATARASGAWDSLLAQDYSSDAIKQLFEPWLVAGVGALPGPTAFQGKLGAAGKISGYAWLDLTSIGGADVASAGLPTKYLATWDSNPDDTVVLGTTLFLTPSRLVTALALGPATAAAPGATSVSDAAAALLPCSDVANKLVAAGQSATEAYVGCDASCAEALCAQGLATLWSDVANAPSDPNLTATIVVTASGPAVVDDQARPTSFEGTWVGSFAVGADSSPVGGSVKGDKPPPPG